MLLPDARLLELEGLDPGPPSSLGRDDAALAASIREVGLLRPPLVAALANGRFRIISGGRRAAVLRALDFTETPAVVLPAASEKRLLTIALTENADRGFNPAEAALLWAYLLERLGRDAARELAGFLGLAGSPKLEAWAEKAARLPEKGLAALAEETLDWETAARLGEMSAEDREAVLDLFAALKPSRQKKRQWLEWLADLSRSRRTAVTEIVQSLDWPLLAETINRQGRPAAENEARQRLWRLRFPTLAALSERRLRLKKALKLPEGLSLNLDPTLEDIQFEGAFSFSDRRTLRSLAGTLNRLADDPALARLLETDE